MAPAPSCREGEPRRPQVTRRVEKASQNQVKSGAKMLLSCKTSQFERLEIAAILPILLLSMGCYDTRKVRALEESVEALQSQLETAEEKLAEARGKDDATLSALEDLRSAMGDLDFEINGLRRPVIPFSGDDCLFEYNQLRTSTVGVEMAAEIVQTRLSDLESALE